MGAHATPSLNENLKSLNESLELVSLDTTKSNYMTVKCKLCKREWDDTIRNLSKHPNCTCQKSTILTKDPLLGHDTRKRDMITHNSLSNRMYPRSKAKYIGIAHTDFVSIIHEVNPHVTVVGNFTRLSDRILTKCNLCNNTWEPLATSLKRGQECPACKGKH